MLVLSAIVMLTTMLVEFAYNTNVHYHLALNERDRLQAYYMARSAYNFMLLELKFDRMFRQIVQSQNLSQYLGDTAKLPLCQQFPMSTGLIRTVFTGGGLAGVMGGDEGDEAAGEDAEKAADEIEDMRRDVSVSQEKEAQEFLQFEGDFDGECVDEGTKINLNAFSGLRRTPIEEGGVSPFDQYKQFLNAFLMKPEFELLFKEADVKQSDVTDNIADWIDSDTEVNELGGRSGGAERSLYDRLGVGYSVRNGKLLTLTEAYLIDGVIDDWFAPIEDDFTIYGDGKINICTAGQDVVESLIKRYVTSTPGLPPVRLDDADEVARLVKAVMDACAGPGTGEAMVAGIANALTAAINAQAGQPAEPEQQPEAASAAAGQDTGFASYITTDSRYFTLKLAGQVMDTTVRVRAVIDVKEQDPKKWKLLYWRVY